MRLDSESVRAETGEQPWTAVDRGWACIVTRTTSDSLEQQSLSAGHACCGFRGRAGALVHGHLDGHDDLHFVLAAIAGQERHADKGRSGIHDREELVLQRVKATVASESSGDSQSISRPLTMSVTSGEP